MKKKPLLAWLVIGFDQKFLLILLKMKEVNLVISEIEKSRFLRRSK